MYSSDNLTLTIQLANHLSFDEVRRDCIQITDEVSDFYFVASSRLVMGKEGQKPEHPAFYTYMFTYYYEQH